MDLSKQATKNINKILKLVRARLNSSSKAKATDENNNVIYVDCDIYSTDMLVQFLFLSLSEFNQTPYFTAFTFEDADFLTTFADVIVEGAVIQALAAQALIERGREFKIEDHGIMMDPPNMSEMLNTQYATMLSYHVDKLRYIKQSEEIKKLNKKSK